MSNELAHLLREAATVVYPHNPELYDELRAKAASLQGQEPVPEGWHEIDSAPRTGRWIYAWRNHSVRPIQVRFNYQYGEFENDDGELVYALTHWTQIPSGPDSPELSPNDAAVKESLTAQPAAHAVPDGWKLVPVEPTARMLDALYNFIPEKYADAVGEVKAYQSMLSAAPQQEGQTVSDIVQRLISAAEDFPEIEENPSDLYCAASVEIQHLRARLAAAEADALDRIDRRRLADQLTELFIAYQYKNDPPENVCRATENDMIFKYRSDPVFHAKVRSVVSGTMLKISAAIDAARGGE